jgi:hypothetical protein
VRRLTQIIRSRYVAQSRERDNMPLGAKRITKTRKTENTKDGKHEREGICRQAAILWFLFRVFVLSHFRDFHDVPVETIAII